MLSGIDDVPPISHAIADGWADFAETILPSIGGGEHAQAHIAFHVGAMYVLEIAQQAIAKWPAEDASFALGLVEAELEEFMKAHAIAVH
jgi:hypothetical protein